MEFEITRVGCISSASSEKSMLEISCELAWQMIYMNCQALFSLKSKNEIECHLLSFCMGFKG